MMLLLVLLSVCIKVRYVIGMVWYGIVRYGHLRAVMRCWMDGWMAVLFVCLFVYYCSRRCD